MRVGAGGRRRPCRGERERARLGKGQEGALVDGIDEGLGAKMDEHVVRILQQHKHTHVHRRSSHRRRLLHTAPLRRFCGNAAASFRHVSGRTFAVEGTSFPSAFLVGGPV